MTMSGNNYNSFFSETHSTSPSLPDIEDLSNSLQNISLTDLGFVENSQTGDEGNRCSMGVHSTFFLGNQSSGNRIESAWNPASLRGRVPQRDIGRAYSVQDLMNGNGNMGSLYPPNLISLSDDQGVGPSTGYRISQLELMGDQERGIWRTGSVLNLGLGSETPRIQPQQDYHWGLTNGWTGRDETSNESFMPNFRPDSRISYNGYNGSNSIRGMQSPDHLTGGLYFHGAQPTRTPFSEEYSDDGNTAPSCEWTGQPLPEAVHLNYFRLHTGDLSLPEGLNCGDIQAIATNPIGCRYLLQILSGREPFAIQKILDGTLEVVFEVMSDHIGNHLFQKLLESCDDNQIETIVARVTECENSLTEVANTKSGTRSVQKLVQIVKKCAPLMRCITLALVPRIQALMTSPYGCHVILCLSQMLGCHYPGELRNMLVETIMRHARSLRCHTYGRNVIKSLCSLLFSSS
ncbi:hypothetical protein MRB53_017045 [Persea americana]|uniref:Uncharacterized protein n=1 Tax=Persea americana TaxID=3435 RepID=A0ACC2M3Z8_PERAE|nr:hypothetical protein MRB53_017045 [Persea americana]